MLTGKRYRLTAATLAIDSSGDKRIAVTIMEGEIIEVTRGPRPDDTRMVDIEWNGKALVMFLADVHDRSEYVGSPNAGT
jgi:hypothetical protein